VRESAAIARAGMLSLEWQACTVTQIDSDYFVAKNWLPLAGSSTITRLAMVLQGVFSRLPRK
jgi:hypothetical protein